MPECTKAEREYLDAAFSRGWQDRPDEILEAAHAVRAERRAAEQEATIGLTVTDWREQEQLMKARIAELEAALAEERAKPKEWAVNYYATQSLDGTTWFVHERVLAWTYIKRPITFTGPDAERHAREHAAKLQAEHDAKGGRP